jgi:hypothetical protein
MFLPVLAGLAGLAAMCSNPPKRRKRSMRRTVRRGTMSNQRPARIKTLKDAYNAGLSEGESPSVSGGYWPTDKDLNDHSRSRDPFVKEWMRGWSDGHEQQRNKRERMSFNPHRKNPTNIDHAHYQAKIRDLSDAALNYAIRDASSAIKAHPTGHKAGYYQDEIHYCSAELRRRQGSKSNPRRRKGRRIRVDEAASRLAWWRHHHNPPSRDLSKVIAALNNPRRRRSRK